MALRPAEDTCESPRNSGVSTDSGIVLFQPSPEHHPPIYHDAENMRLHQPYISSFVNSRPYLGGWNENILSTPMSKESSNADGKRVFSRIPYKLARHPWTESVEFTELWSDIPDTSVDHKQQKCSEGVNGSASNAVPISSYDSSRISLVLQKYSWAGSTEFVELWTDIPRELFTIQNHSYNWKWSANQNGIESPSNISLTKNLSGPKQDLTPSSSIFNSGTTTEKLPKVSRNTPSNSTSKQSNSIFPKRNEGESCEKFSVSPCNIERTAMNSRYFIIMLTMKILLSLVPISAIYMGAVHIGTCPANEVATNLVYITGIVGLFFTGCHVAHHVARSFFRYWKEPLRAAVRIMRNITVVLMILEMIVFYSMSPSFENSENYCDEMFYKYTFYMNFAAAGIVILSVLLQYTSCCKHQVENEAL